MSPENDRGDTKAVAEIGSHRHGVADVPHFLFHRGRVIVVWIVAQTAIFPLEHWAWENLPGMSAVTEWMGL